MDVEMILRLLAWPLWGFVVAYGLAFRPWRWRRLPRALFPSLDLLMCGALASGLVALQHPWPLERSAVSLVEWTGLPEQMDGIDLEIHELQTLPERTWYAVKEELGLGEDERPALPPPPQPGPLRAAVLPPVEELVEVVLRFGTYGASLAVMGVALVMRLWFMRSRRRGEERAHDRAGLEDRVRRLEKEVGRLAAYAGSSPLLESPGSSQL